MKVSKHTTAKTDRAFSGGWSLRSFYGPCEFLRTRAERRAERRRVAFHSGNVAPLVRGGGHHIARAVTT